MPHPWLRLVNHVALRSSAPPALFSAARSARVLSCCCPSLQFSSPLYRGFSPHLQLSRSFSDQPKLDFEKKEKGLFKIATIPNALCAARIAATPVIGYFIVIESFSTAFSLFLAASVTDLLDGYIARNVPGQRSLLGSVLDPVADKLLISTMFITMTYAALIPIYLTSIVLLRDVCLIVGGFYKRYKMMQPPYSLDRFFNPQVSSMQIVPTLVSKVNTVLQITLVAASLASPIFEFSADAKTGIFYLGCLTAFTTVYSGLQYAAGQGFKRLKNPLKFRQKQ